jgi:hypothetical protein
MSDDHSTAHEPDHHRHAVRELARLLGVAGDVWADLLAGRALTRAEAGRVIAAARRARRALDGVRRAERHPPARRSIRVA